MMQYAQKKVSMGVFWCGWMVAGAFWLGVMLLPLQARAFLASGVPQSGVGVGYDVDLNGFTIRFGNMQGLRFDVSLGFGIDADTGGQGTVSVDITPGFRILYPVFTHKMLQVHAVGGAYVLMRPTNSAFAMDVSFFGGFLPEIFILERLSIEIMLGFAFNVNAIGSNNVKIALGTIGKGISIVSGAAFHWYF